MKIEWIQQTSKLWTRTFPLTSLEGESVMESSFAYEFEDKKLTIVINIRKFDNSICLFHKQITGVESLEMAKLSTNSWASKVFNCIGIQLNEMGDEIHRM